MTITASSGTYSARAYGNVAREVRYLREVEVSTRARGRFDFADLCRQIADALEARGDLNILQCEFPAKGGVS